MRIPGSIAVFMRLPAFYSLFYAVRFFDSFTRRFCFNSGSVFAYWGGIGCVVLFALAFLYKKQL